MMYNLKLVSHIQVTQTNGMKVLRDEVQQCAAYSDYIIQRVMGRVKRNTPDPKIRKEWHKKVRELIDVATSGDSATAIFKKNGRKSFTVTVEPYGTQQNAEQLAANEKRALEVENQQLKLRIKELEAQIPPFSVVEKVTTTTVVEKQEPPKATGNTKRNQNKRRNKKGKK